MSHINKRIVRLGLLIAATMLIGGCATAQKQLKPVVLSVQGPVKVLVTSFAGDVRIIADPEATEATITATTQAYHSLVRIEEAAASLANIQFHAVLVPAEIGQAIQVTTSSDDAEDHYQGVHLIITAPMIDGASVHTKRGSVVLDQISGEVDVTTNDGDVSIITTYAMTRPVKVLNVDGDIIYRVRGESTGKFDCEAVHGSVNFFAQHSKAVVHRTSDHDSLSATLNDGENAVLLRTVHGDINVSVSSDPHDFGLHLFH
jgi:hypothetical protein